MRRGRALYTSDLLMVSNMSEDSQKSLKEILLDAWSYYKKVKHKRSFWLPDTSLFGVGRMVVIVVVSLFFFGKVCRPARISGGSMMPTYPSIGFNFCWEPVFWFSKPHRGQVIVAKYAGEDIMLLKRVVALAGDTVAFKDGKLLVNGIVQNEPYVKYKCEWNLPERKVALGHVYVIGDNRSMPIDNHKFGQIAVDRIIGVPLW